MSFSGIALGAHGEKLAARWYQQAGYQVVARNWRCELGEIDLLVRREKQLVVAEVKTRSTDRFGVPAYAVTIAKQKKLRALARAWLAGTDEFFDEVRFDVVSVVGREVEVIEAAF